jgi:hypothetical protein
MQVLLSLARISRMSDQYALYNRPLWIHMLQISKEQSV